MLNPKWVLASQYICTLLLYIYLPEKMLKITCFVIIPINTFDLNLQKIFERQYIVSKFSILMTVACNSKYFLLQKHIF